MATYPEVKTEIVNGVTETDGNQVNNIEDYLGIIGDEDPDTITFKLTNAESVGPGHKHPISDLREGDDGTVAYKDPADSLWKGWLPDTIGLVTKAGEQTISEKKTFSVLPEANITPTTDNQLARKKYVDDNVILPKYGGMYRTNFTEEGPPINWGYRQALINFTGEGTDGVTFNAGSTSTILSITDAGNGFAKIESISHGLQTGDIIGINGTENYNRIWEVTYFDPNNFLVFCIFFVAESPTGDSVWYKPSSLKVNAGAAGVYKVQLSAIVRTEEGLMDAHEVELFLNGTSREELYLKFFYYGGANPAELSVARTALLTLAVNDVLFITQMNRSQTYPLLMPCAELTISRIDT